MFQVIPRTTITLTLNMPQNMITQCVARLYAVHIEAIRTICFEYHSLFYTLLALWAVLVAIIR